MFMRAVQSLFILGLFFSSAGLAFATMQTTKYHKDGTQTVEFGQFKELEKSNDRLVTSCAYDNGRAVMSTETQYRPCVHDSEITYRKQYGLNAENREL